MEPTVLPIERPCVACAEANDRLVEMGAFENEKVELLNGLRVDIAAILQP